jgi:hypothetical protein
LSENEELRMRQVLAEYVAPRVAVQIYRVDGFAGGEGFFVIEVPRSADAPHAVRVNNALRYPKRDGARVRWLAENEVADAYRNRFTAARAQIERLGEVHSDGIAGLSRYGWAEDTAWLTIAVVPDLPGALVLSHHTAETVGQHVRRRPHPFDPPFSSIRNSPVRSTTGFRRVAVTQSFGSATDPVRIAHWQLHTEGSGFAAVRVGSRLRTWAGDTLVDPPRFAVYDEEMMGAAAQIIDALVEHAVDRCGATGNAVLRATIEVHDPSGEHLPVVVTHERDPFGRDEDDPGVVSIPPSDHSVDLDAIRSSKVELLVAIQLVLTDLMQALGRAECWQISRDGSVRITYFRSEFQGSVRDWCATNGVDCTQESVT